MAQTLGQSTLNDQKSINRIISLVSHIKQQQPYQSMRINEAEKPFSAATQQEILLSHVQQKTPMSQLQQSQQQNPGQNFTSQPFQQQSTFKQQQVPQQAPLIPEQAIPQVQQPIVIPQHSNQPPQEIKNDLHSKFQKLLQQKMSGQQSQTQESNNQQSQQLQRVTQLCKDSISELDYNNYSQIKLNVEQALNLLN